MTKVVKYTSPTTAKRIKEELQELKTLEPKDDLIKSWSKDSKIIIKQDDREMTMSELYAQSLMNEKPIQKDEIVSILEEVIEKKQTFKDTRTAKRKIFNKEGGALVLSEGRKVELELNTMKIEFNDEDKRLFSMFRKCNNTITLRAKGSVLQCTRNGRGEIDVPENEWLEDGIATAAKDKFEKILKEYYFKTVDLLSELSEKNEIEDGSLSPIEDLMSTDVPASLSMLFNLVDYQTERKEGLGKDAVTYITHNYQLRPKDKMHFRSMFQYVLDHWKYFNKCISGQKEFIAWSNSSDVTSVSYWNLPTEKVECPKNWLDHLKAHMSNRMLSRYVWYVGACMDASNSAQQAIIACDAGGKGKSFTFKCWSSALPKMAVGSINDEFFCEYDKFGLSSSRIYETHISVIDEVSDSNNLCTSKAKKLIGNSSMTLEVKNKESIEWNPINHKLFVFSNKPVVIKDYANRRRFIPICFKGSFTWSQELQDSLMSNAKDFLDYAYCYYKNCPMMRNGQYVVLSESDEKEFLKGNLEYSSLSDKEKDRLSKKSFTEDCFDGYYITDDYSETDEVIDIFEPMTDLIMDVTYDKNDKIYIKEILPKVKKYIGDNKDIASFFNVRIPYNYANNYEDLELNIYGKNSGWYKFKMFLKNTKSLDEGKNRNGRFWYGAKLKSTSGVKESIDEISDNITSHRQIDGDDFNNNLI